MKNNINISKLFSLVLLMVTAMTSFVACEEEDKGKYEMTGGLPTVYYVRYQDKELEEQLLDGAYMNENIVIIGENLTSVQEVWFNNVKAVLNMNLITKNTLFVNVPGDLPSVRTDKVYFVNSNKDTLAYDFQVKIPAPLLNRIKCENVSEGGEVVLYGDYFLATDPSLINVFVGDYQIPTADIVSYEKNKLVFKAPAMDIKGQVEVKTLYGSSGRSKDVFHDDRGFITGFEEGFVGGWGRPDASKIQNDPALAVTGNYVRIDGTTITLDGDGWVGGSIIINIWGEDNGVPTGNLFPSDPATSTLKFDVNVLQAWSAGPMIFCFEAQGQQENYLWADGTQPRGVWVPWLSSGSYVSDGWETVSIPLKDFKYNGAGEEIPLATSYGSLGIAIHNRGNKEWIGTAECTPVILIDNIRVIP
ncbi:hypothetical protein FACS189421_12470 [Bacteroidia bacterium]|nr:hypothetical protein FACS189421_12470 [Bacteroidia bacterium]